MTILTLSLTLTMMRKCCSVISSRIDEKNHSASRIWIVFRLKTEVKITSAAEYSTPGDLSILYTSMCWPLNEKSPPNWAPIALKIHCILPKIVGPLYQMCTAHFPTQLIDF